MKKLSIIIICATLFSLFALDTESQADTLAPLAVITVDTETDSNEVTYQACTADPNDCSLRGAITKSNNTSGGIGTIILPAGTYRLSIDGEAENFNATGDLDIRQPVTIIGAGQSCTFIQAGSTIGDGIDRVVQMLHTDGTVSLSDMTIRWGHISTEFFGGGGIYQDEHTNLIMERVTVTENTVDVVRAGGGIFSIGNLTINQSTISNNVTPSEGGGIYSVSPILTIENSTISGNTGNYGGGIAVNYLAIFRNITISGNSATIAGGGISEWNSADLTLYNSTVTNNTVTGGATSGWAINDRRIFNAYNSIMTASGTNNVCVNGMDTGDHNIATDSACGTGAIVANPLLQALADNGGLTLTHALSIGSPAIDAGDDTSCTVRDQRGVIRHYDGDGNGSLICDIGAYEYNTGLTLLNIFMPMTMKP